MTRALLASAVLAAFLAGCATEPPKPVAAAPKCEPAPTQLMMSDLEPGQGDPINPRSAVLVGYTGWLYDPCKPDHKGEMFDTSAGRPTPFGLIVGTGRVIQGWDEGLIGMREKGKRLLIIPPDKAYGAKGAGDKIPPNATLVFEVELLQVIMRGPPEPAK